MPRRSKQDVPSSISRNDLIKRLADIEKEREKLKAEEKHIHAQIASLDTEQIRSQIAFDKIVMFEHKKEEVFGKVIGLFKDAIQVNLCTSTGDPLEKPEGAKRVRMVTTLKYSEVLKVL